MAYPRGKDIITIIIKVNFIFSFKSGGFAELKKDRYRFSLGATNTCVHRLPNTITVPTKE